MLSGGLSPYNIITLYGVTYFVMSFPDTAYLGQNIVGWSRMEDQSFVRLYFNCHYTNVQEN